VIARLIRHRLFRIALLLLAALVVFIIWARRTETPVLPAGVTKESRQFSLAGQSVAVSLYRPAVDENAPLVVIAHGFTRSKRYMAGWGAHLAGEGFLVATLTQPALADHTLNGRVIAALVDELKGRRRVAVMGFSMGGLTTLLAAAQTPVDAWVGLDPVDMDGSGEKVAKTLHAPAAVLLAEPEAWNMHGNARRIIAALPDTTFTLKVRGATHLDCESPTDLLGQIACGFVDEKHQALFKRYATAFLRAKLLADPAAEKMLEDAATDESVTR
jgi:dienelactone hydrolase